MAVLVTGLIGGDIENSFAANDRDKKVLIQVRDTNAQPIDATCIIEWDVSDNEEEIEVQTNSGGIASGFVPSNVSEVEITCESDEQSKSVENELKENGTTVIRVMFDSDKTNDDSDETNDDSDETNDELEIEVEVEDGIAKIEIEHGDEDQEFEIDWISEEDVIDEIVSRTDLTRERIEEVITFEFDDSDETNDELEIEELREENKALRQQITELTERLQNLELIIQEQIKVMLDTLESLKNQ